MKKGTHPEYQQILFVDSQTQDQFLIRSTLKPKDRAIFKGDGKEYPTLVGSPTSASHPFYCGGSTIQDTEGRIAKFAKRYTLQAEKNKAAAEKQDIAAKEKVKAKKKK